MLNTQTSRGHLSEISSSSLKHSHENAGSSITSVQVGAAVGAVYN